MAHCRQPFDIKALSCFFEQLWTNSSDPFWICTPVEGDFELVMVNDAARRIHPKQVPGSTVRTIIGHGPEAAPLIAGYYRCMETGESVTFEQRPVLFGTPRLFETLLVPVKNDAGEITHIWGTARDLTRFLTSQNELMELNEKLEAKISQRTRELEEANRRLYELSTTDALTGIANRRRFDAVMQEERARAMRTGNALSLIMIDIDHFKAFNDHYGHQEGDAILRRIAGTFRSCARRPGDLAVRYGGEEFCLILPDTCRSGALETAERVREGVEALNIPHALSPFGRVTVSLGVATFDPAASNDATGLLPRADNALYRAKSDGRNCVRLTESGSS